MAPAADETLVHFFISESVRCFCFFTVGKLDQDIQGTPRYARYMIPK